VREQTKPGEGPDVRISHRPLWECKIQEVTQRSAESACRYYAANVEARERSGLHKDGKPLVESRLGQQQARIRELLKMPKDFVLHSLRHTFGTV
jgi:hypothetical protein